MRVIALVDGEHHPSVVRDALARLGGEHEIVSVLFVGGEEKVPAAVLAEAPDRYGYDVIVGTDLPETEADAVFDLSGAPVLDTHARRALALDALDRGLEYLAPGIRLRPPPAERIDTSVPILAVTGTGKRTGKTALGGHLAALLRARGAKPVLVSMGRGGPPEPQPAGWGERLDVERLLEIARAGAHAASDYLEDALLSGVPAVGTRRCAEGPAGEVYDSNVADGVRLALTLDPDVVVLEGSGASLPPVACDRTVCVTRGEAEAFAGLGPLRLMRADLIVLLGHTPPELAEWTRAPAIACRLEPEPAEPIAPGRRVAVFTTALPEVAEAMRGALAGHGFEVVLLSTNLARRADLERDLDAAMDERWEGVRTVILRNEVVPLPGELDLDDELWRLYEEVAAGVSR